MTRGRMAYDNNNIFAKILRGEIPCVRVYEDDKTLAFMFESAYLYRPTSFAMGGGLLQSNYADCWTGMPKNFHPKTK